MRDILNDLELALTDLMQTGAATAGAETVRQMERLSEQSEGAGLHTGGALFGEIARFLRERGHTMEKSDRELTAAVCRAVHYIELCRERMTEDDIRVRWQEGGRT